MTETPQKALLLGAALFITIALITLGVVVYNTASDGAKTANKEFSSIQTELSEQTFLVYDNTDISGSQVINAIRKFDDDELGIKVTTGKGTAWYNYDATNPDTLTTASGAIANTSIETNNAYINPSGKFAAKIIRDSNDVIRAIQFTQQ
ncbi:ABC transporter permease [Bacillus sp. AFS040349]|uniref:ABC transporter permease n=1 Tax=Bacillus sp. AFS040349 TaxID=2033502 RepID=UPI000BFD8D21|nr:ABC transporter permease [Bacillus sp. AFS040349]PGT83230.1 ABC transporter permease [Bacillus sp. AFS040349]